MPPRRVPFSVMPSFTGPRQTRAYESRPLRPLWSVLNLRQHLALAGYAEAGGGGGGFGRVVAQRFPEAAHAAIVFGGAEQHGDGGVGGQVLAQLAVNFVGAGCDVFEDFLHDRVLVVGKDLKQRVARFLSRSCTSAGNSGSVRRAGPCGTCRRAR